MGKKNLQEWRGEGDKGGGGGGGGGEGKKTGVRKLKVKKGKEKKKGGKKKTMETGRIEPSSCIWIGKLLLKSPMLSPSPTGTLQLHCEQFWTFIVYANAHAQCDVQHTHTQAELYINHNNYETRGKGEIFV